MLAVRDLDARESRLRLRVLVSNLCRTARGTPIMPLTSVPRSSSRGSQRSDHPRGGRHPAAQRVVVVPDILANAGLRPRRRRDSRPSTVASAEAAPCAPALEEHLTRSLGVRFATRPDGKAREVLGVSLEAMALISPRWHAVTAKAAELIAAFEARHDREPNSAERDRPAHQATFATRQAKPHEGETRE